MQAAYTVKTPSKILSFAFAAAVTLAILGSLDALATSGQSAEALLAQHGTQQMACADPARKG
jgi:hypothetical protein